MKIWIADKEREVVIEKKRNKNMYLRVREDGTLFLTVPYRTSMKNIEAFIRGNEAWIRKEDRRRKKQEVTFLDGSDGIEAKWLGRTMDVSYFLSKRNFLMVEENKLLFYVKDISEDTIRKTFYKEGNKQLAAFIDERRKDWDTLICRANHKPLPEITIRYMTSRWGSCTPSKSSIRISSRLIHFPLGCLDYILLHEYAHILVPNHSSAFYDIVRKFMPDYKVYSDMLK